MTITKSKQPNNKKKEPNNTNLDLSMNLSVGVGVECGFSEEQAGLVSVLCSLAYA